MTVYKAFVEAAKRADRELVTLRSVAEKHAAKALPAKGPKPPSGKKGQALSSKRG